VRDGKVTKILVYYDRELAFADLGLSESAAMSQENVELAYRAWEAFNGRDLAAFLALMDDDVETIPRTVAVEGGGHYHGHDGVRHWWKDLFDVFPDFAIEAVEVRDLGDLVFAAVRVRGHGGGSDTPTEEAIWNVIRWRRGKCVWWSSFDTQAEALEALGLSE
jgi:ketosteroid isomerase-like protein